MFTEDTKFGEPIVGTMTGSEVIGRVTSVMPTVDRSNPVGYERGREDADGMDYVTVSGNNVWGGRSKSGGSVQSYEKIGYHTGAAAWLLGVLSTDCPVYAYCEGGWRVVTS